MELLKFLEGMRSPFPDIVFGLITRLGEETVGIVILCLILWCINKRIAYGIGITYFLSGLTVQGMKISFRIDRPWVAYPSLNPVPSALQHATGYSFPSGHTQSAAALFGSLGMQVKNIPFKTICFTLAVLVAFSRLYLGVHTFLDVSVSLLICCLFTALTLKFFTGDTVSKKKELIIFCVMVLYAIIIIIIASVLFARGKIEHVYLSDCFKAAGAGIGFSAGMYIERIYINFPVKTKNIFMQVIKFFLGLIGVIVIKEGLKLVIGTGLAADTIRYFLILTWITAFFPLVIKRIFSGKNLK